jgi:hypothetical protein
MEVAQTIEPTVQEGYTSWAAVAGYFDGDGSVNIDVRAYTIHWVIAFSDNWLGQIEQIREFLIRHGVNVQKPRRVGFGGWMCEVKDIASLMIIAKEMLQSGGIFKKKRELQLLPDYYSDSITGTEVLEGFNSEVLLGVRVGKIRRAEMPYTHSEGLVRARRASNSEQKTLGVVESRQLIEEYLSSNVTGKSLAEKYGVSEATVSRLLKRSGIDTKTRARRTTIGLLD